MLWDERGERTWIYSNFGIDLFIQVNRRLTCCTGVCMKNTTRSDMEHLTHKGVVIRETDFGDNDRYISVLT